MTHVILTCSEHFTDLALNELQRHHPQVALVESLSPRHVLLKAPFAFGALVKPWRTTPPIYLHHLFPVHRTLTLDASAADFDLLREAVQSLCRDDFVLQPQIVGDFPYPAITLQQVLCPQQNRSRSTRADGRVLSLLIVGRWAYLGISWAAQNLSPFAGGIPCFDESVPNRAGLKLLEALTTFALQPRPGQHVLDLGAAPGAWTEILRRRGMIVTTVAPTPMYHWLASDPQVKQQQMTAEAYLTQCETTFHWIVNDMKLDPQDSAHLMVQYANHLQPDGLAIMTLKLRLRNPRRVMDHAFRLLRKRYRIVRVRQLVSNRKEVTLLLRPHAAIT